MAEKLTTAIEVKVGVSGDASVKSIKSQLREAVNEAANLAAKFGEASPEATKAAGKVAELRDRMEDLNNRVKALNPDKFQRFATFASGIASGFSAAQGAMALFGAESDDVQKQLARVQGAMAFAQGIQGVKDFAQSFSGLGTVIKTQVVTAFSTLKGAMMATGIGALVAGITTLIVYFEDLASSAEKAAAAEEEALQKRAEFENTVLQLDLADIEREQKLQVSRAKAKNATEEEIFDIEQKFRNKRINALQTYRDALQKDTEDYIKANKAYLDAVSELEIADNNRQADINKQQAERRAAEQERNRARLAELDAKRDREILDFAREQEQIQAAEKLNDQQQKVIEQRAELNGRKREKERADELAAEQAHAQAKLDLANSVAIGLGAIGDIVAAGTNRAVGLQKVAALAQIGIHTAVALTAALRNANAPTPDNVATGGLAGVAKYAGLAAQILSAAAKARAVLKSGTATNISAAGAGAFATVPEAGRTFTAFGLPSDRVEQAGGAQQMRVYVVDKNITRQQKRSRAIQRTSVI